MMNRTGDQSSTMKLKSKPVRRSALSPAPRTPAPVAVRRSARRPDLGDRRLQLLLGAKR